MVAVCGPTFMPIAAFMSFAIAGITIVSIVTPEVVTMMPRPALDKDWGRITEWSFDDGGRVANRRRRHEKPRITICRANH